MRAATTRDHVPPRSLFPTPPPPNLITVPACAECHVAFNLDDEYFKLMIGMKREISQHPDGHHLAASVIRGLQRPEGRPFAVAVARTMKNVQLTTPNGLFLGTTGGFKPDFRRMETFAGRVVRGLYYKEFGQPLPPSHELKVTPLAASTEEIRREARALFDGEKARQKGDVFAYVVTVPVQGATAWILEFFQDVAFLAITVDPNDPAAAGFLPTTPSTSGQH